MAITKNHTFENIDWLSLEDQLNARGNAVINGLLSPETCKYLITQYQQQSLFRKRVVMERHGYGRGEYQYFAYPLLDLVGELRQSIYAALVPVANRWQELMGLDTRFPSTHAEFLQRCHAAGQNLPTPLMLRYETGDYNCLHQDLYGEHVFPLQIAILLSEPQQDFTGGEFVMTEQRPRMQSRAEVLPLTQGDALVFAVHQRPVNGTRGIYRVNHRHGVSELRSGERYTLGVIFHDAN